MKKLFILILAQLMAGQISAQVANWIIHPDYDSIYFFSESNFIITDSVNEKIVWTSDGKRLFMTSDRVYPFSEGLAVTTEQKSDIITGFYNLKGEFTPLEGNCSVAHDYPYFSDGYLVVKRNDKYYFADTKGQLNKHGVVLAYPFNHGYASCCDYKNPDKPKDKDTYNFLINRNMQIQTLSFNGKDFSRDDLEFISSINNQGVGIIVAKRKVYYFKCKKELEPVFVTGKDHNSKQAKINGKVSESLSLANSDYLLYMKDQYSCLFNTMMIPMEIGPNLNRVPFDTNHTIKEEKSSPLHITEKNSLFGFSIDGVNILPPQFEAIHKCVNNDAFVKTSGKQGMLHISKDDNFHATINGKKEICFRHRNTLAKMRVDMPSYIPSEKTFINSLDTSCNIIKASWKDNKTPEGNSIEYDCELDFPVKLFNYTIENPNNPKQETIPIVYPIQIISDGIKFLVVNLETNVWYFKSITIDIDESSKTVNKGTGTFTFDVNTERLSKDDYYPLTVEIEADSSYLNPECLPFTSNNSRYKGIVHDLEEGANDITIKILEDGCPPILIPHTITYTKPSAKNKYKKEGIVIKKKTEEEEDLHFLY